MNDELEWYIEIRDFLRGLDERHRLYALQYAEQLSLGEPAPSNVGLERELVREIRRRVWGEWSRRIRAMPGSRWAG